MRPVPPAGGGPAHRRRGQQPPAPGPARHLGALPRPGGGPGRLRPGAAARRLRAPPTASTASSTSAPAWRCCRSSACTAGSGWDPQRHKLALYSIPIGTQACTPSATPSAPNGTGSAPSPTSATAPPAEGDVSRRSTSPPSTPRWCSSARTTSGPSRCRWPSRWPPRLRRAGFGFPGVQVDGNDVLAVYAVTRAAAERARGGGPTLIEAITYRLGAHTTTDDPTRYRTSDELDMWKAREPIGRYRAFLEQAGLWSEELEADVQAEADRVAAEVRATVGDARPAPVRPGRPRLRRPAGHPDGAVAAAPGVRGPVPGRGVREASMAQITMARRSTPPCATPWRPTTGWCCWARTSAPSAGLPHHRRAAQGLRRAAGHGHPARRVGHHGGEHRAGPARLPARARDAVRRLQLPGARPDHQPPGQVPEPLGRHPAHAGGLPHPLRRGHRRRRAPLREPRDHLLPHRRAQGGHARRPPTPTRCCASRSSPRTR